MSYGGKLFERTSPPSTVVKTLRVGYVVRDETGINTILSDIPTSEFFERLVAFDYNPAIAEFIWIQWP